MGSRLWLIVLLLVGLLGAVGAPPPAAAQTTTSLRLAPPSGPSGTPLMISGEGWPAGQFVTISFGRSTDNLDQWLVDWVQGRVGDDGRLDLRVVVPHVFGALDGRLIQVWPGDYDLVVATTAGGGSTSASATFRVQSEPTPPPVIDGRFHDYYYRHDGGRLLGPAIDEVSWEHGRRVQYFEKGRLEEEPSNEQSGGSRFLFGRLGAELTARSATLPVGGDESSVTYAGLSTLAEPSLRQPPPPDWTTVGQARDDGAVFVPYDSALRPAPGHYVPGRLWAYLNRVELFPGGWLHDVGLPLTAAINVQVTKLIDGTPVERTITLQLFERTVLTDDPANPAGFEIERANVGRDYRRVLTGPLVPGDPVLHPRFRWSQAALVQHDLPTGMVAPAWEWLSEHSVNVRMEDELMMLERRLESEGWSIQPGPAGGAATGWLAAVKGARLQVITWWQGVRPSLPPEQPDLGIQMRVVIGWRQ